MLTEAQFTAEFNLLRKQNFWNQFDNNQLKIILGTMIAAGLTGGGGSTVNSIQATVSSESQFSLPLIANVVSTFTITAETKLFTVCTNGADLVYYTTDGSTPTDSNAWFFPYAKETWDNNIPVGSTIKFLSPTANKLVLVARY